MAKLNIADVRNLQPRAQRYEVPEGSIAGLVVRVTPSGVKSFSLSYRRRDDGVMRRMTLGRFGGRGGVSLYEAREAAGDALEIVRAGGDPAGDRKRKRAAAAALKAAGGPATLADEVRGYLDNARSRLRPKTLETYGTAADKFVRWVDAEGIKLPTDLTRAHLVEFAAYLAELPCHTPAAKRGRGAKAATGRRRSPQSVNRELRTIKTILNGLRKAGKVPQLDRDALTDCLAALRVDREAPKYLSPKQIERLLAACERHDAETFTETREEHAGRGEVGTTARYQPIRPLVLFLLLTGCRRGEALALRWADVELDATDHHDNAVGELRLPAKITKTHHARRRRPPADRRLGREARPHSRSDCCPHGVGRVCARREGSTARS